MKQKNTLMHARQDTAIYALTPQGAELAFRLAKMINQKKIKDAPNDESDAHTTQRRFFTTLDIFIPETLSFPNNDITPQRFSGLRPLVKRTFNDYGLHIFITATGIAVRSIASSIQHKLSDPAVLVIDQKGEFVISLLSGHLGGANEASVLVANIIGATPVITTATDVEGLPSLDMLAIEKKLTIATPNALKYINGALIKGETVPVHDPENWLELSGSIHQNLFSFHNKTSYDELAQVNHQASIVVTHQAYQSTSPHILILHPPVFVAGIGCKRGISAETIIQQLRYAFNIMGASLSSLHSLASASVKQDEKGIAEAAIQLGIPVFFFPVDVLHNFPVINESPKCRETFGLRGVCEPSALAGAGAGASLVQQKIAGNGVTIAVARRLP